MKIATKNGGYSFQKIAELLDGSTSEPRSPIERQHLLPKAYLEKSSINGTERKDQIANYTLVEWGDNAKIGDKSPEMYLPEFADRFSGKQLERMCFWHALPEVWEQFDYDEFLRKRREMIANLVCIAYDELEKKGSGHGVDEIKNISDLVREGENALL